MKLFTSFFLSMTIFLVACGDQKTASQYIQSGQNHYDKKEWKSAIIEFKNAVKLEPDNPRARALLGESYLETYSTNAAIKELQRAKSLGDDSDKILINLGKAYALGNEHQKIIDEININKNQSSSTKASIYALRANAYLSLDDSSKALTVLNKAKELDQNSVDVRLAWANFEKSKNNITAQKEWLKPLLTKDDGVADAWSMMGEIEQNAGNFEAAEQAFTQSISLRKYGHIDLVRRALVKIAMHKYEGAQSDLDKLKKMGANWPIVEHTEGVIAFENKKFEIAQRHFQNVLSKIPDYSPSQFMLSLIYYKQKNYQNAVTLIEQYTTTNPDQDRAQYIYASSLLNLGQVDKALKILNDLYKNNENDTNVLALLGSSNLIKKNYSKAIEFFQKSVSINPDNATSRMQLGLALLSDKSTYINGQKELLKAIELDPSLDKAYINLFKSYLAKKNYPEALSIASKLDEQNPASSQGANLMALTHLAEKQKDKAITLLQKTLERFPQDFTTTHNLGLIYLQDNKLQDAKKIYQNVLDKAPTHLQALNQMALISLREGDQEKMITYLSQAQEGNPDSLSARLILSAQFLKQNKATQAITLLNDASEEQKKLPGYILVMAQSKIAVKESQHAIRLLKSLTSVQSSNTAAFLMLAQAYSIENQPVKVRETLEKLLTINPDHLNANLALARLDLIEGKTKDFENRVAKLGKRYPKNQYVQFLEAKIASGNKNFKDAITTLASIMQDSPNSEVALNLAINQWQSGDRVSAISGLEIWTQENEKDERALMLLAEYYLDENRQDEAKEIYSKLYTLLPDNSAVLNNLAWVLKDTDPEQGVKFAERALKLSPESPFINDTLAMLNLALGNNDIAMKLSEKAVSLAPDFGEIRFNYALTLIANDKKTEARGILSDLYKKTRSSETKNKIKAELDKL